MHQRRQAALKLLTVPALAFLLLFFVVPVALLLRYSFSEFEGGDISTSFTIANYLALVEDPLHRLIIIRTLLIAAVATVLCVLLGYPIALGIVRASRRWRPILLVLTLTPLLIGGVIRCYGWLLLLDEHGLVNDFLLAIERVSGEQRVGKGDGIPAESKTILADIDDAQSSHNSDSQRAVDQRFFELSMFCIFRVEMYLV